MGIKTNQWGGDEEEQLSPCSSLYHVLAYRTQQCNRMRFTWSKSQWNNFRCKAVQSSC